MNRNILFFLVAVLTFTACKHQEEKTATIDSEVHDTLAVQQRSTLPIETRKDSMAFWVEGGCEDFAEFGDLKEYRAYSICWPVGDYPELQRSILKAAFDAPKEDFETAAHKYLSRSVIDDYAEKKATVVKNMKDFYANETHTVTVDYDTIGPIYRFYVLEEDYSIGAAHPSSETTIINYDVDKNRIITIVDLMDTTHLRKVLKQAVKTLPCNKDVLESVYSISDPIPISRNFIINRRAWTISLMYNRYEIAPYSMGPQEIELPLEWLVKQVKLTDYAKELLQIPDEL